MSATGLISQHCWQVVSRLYFWCVILLACTYMGSGITVVAPEEVGLVFRTGRLLGEPTTTAVHPPGLLLAWPYPVDRVLCVPVKRETSLEIDHFWQAEPGPQTEGENVATPCRYAMTGDENLIGMRMTAKYLISSPVAHVRCSEDVKGLIQRVVVQELQKTLNQSSIDEALQLRSERYHISQIVLEDTSLPPSVIEVLASLPPGKAWTSTELRAELAHRISAEGSEHTLNMILSKTRTSFNLAETVRANAEQELARLGCGVTLTSVEIHGAHPPHEVLDAFKAFQTARIEQETTRDRMLALANETRIDSESIALQTIAEAKGNVEKVRADVAEQIALFEADRALAQGPAAVATKERLRRQSLQQILENAQRVYFVPDIAEGGQFRLILPPQGGQR